jgi:oligopeptide transport system substrate-binding protein
MMRNSVWVVAGIALGLAACSSSENDAGKMVLHYYHKDDVKHIDPANAFDTFSTELVTNLYEALYQYDYLNETYRLVPLLAADMPKISPDHKTYTIRIKRGVRFHDDPVFPEGKGREVKAQDFVYAIKRLAIPAIQSNGWWLVDGKIQGINAFHDKLVSAPKPEIPKLLMEKVDGIVALDDYTLQIKCVKPYPQLMFALAMSFTAPMAREVVEKYADDRGNLVDKAVGTGAFYLKRWDRGNRIVLERNPNYHEEFYPATGAQQFRKRGLFADAGKPMPFLDRIYISVIKEAQPMWLKFMNGEIDIALIPKDNFSTAITQQVNLSPNLAARGIRLSVEPGLIFYYVSFNMKDKVVGSSKLLRQAISSAIDRDKWIELFTNGRGRKMVTALPAGIPDRPKNAALKYDFNLERAKDLLKRAGYPGGKGVPTLRLDMRSADSASRQLGEFFQTQFAQIGLKLEVVYNTFPAFLEKMKNGDLQISYGGWHMDYPDAENVYQLLYGPNQAPGPNDSSFNHPEMNKLYEKMAFMDSGADRAATIERMEAILQEEVPWAFGYYHTDYYLTQPWVLNFRSNDLIQNKFKYIRINTETKNRYREQK